MTITAQNRISVIGGSNVDIIATYSTQPEAFSDSFQGQISTSAGGVARNIAENLARMGSQVTFISAIGDDDLSTIITSAIDHEHIDAAACRHCTSSRSDTYLSLFDVRGELLHAINQMRLIDSITPDYLSGYEAEITSSRLIVADCNLSADSLDWLIRLPGRPRLFFDGVSSEKIKKLEEALSLVDGLKCNHREAAELAGLSVTSSPSDVMDRLTGLGVNTIIQSLGPDGILFSHMDERIHIPHEQTADNIVSVSGAGDALFAGYLHGYSHGLSHHDALSLGVDAAQMTLGCASAVHPDIGIITSKSMT